MRLTLIILLSYLALSYCGAHYFMGGQGESCFQACHKAGKNCHPRIITNDNTLLFTQLGIRCTPDHRPWSSEDQPSFVSDPHHPHYGKCMGFTGTPDAGQCFASNPSAQRLCRCDDPEDSASTFGAGFSNGNITTKETWVFQHYVTPGDVGVLTHLWVTYPTKVDNGTIIRYYIDGETKASIEFTPSLACGVGFYDNYGPWGTEWIGKGANDSGWYNNFRIPFQKSIVVTVQHKYAEFKKFFLIIRGSLNVPIVVGGRTLPSNAKMNLAKISDKTYQVLDWVPLVNESSGAGAFWMVTLAAESGNVKFMEGCIHAYFDGKNEFPGVVLATGTEDYFDSAFFFNAGRYHLPVSGFTHMNKTATRVTWSGYRFHDTDPLFWKNGFKLIWRNGDMDDNAGMKCHSINRGKIHANPTASKIYAYSWYYTWPSQTVNIEL